MNGSIELVCNVACHTDTAYAITPNTSQPARRLSGGPKRLDDIPCLVPSILPMSINCCIYDVNYAVKISCSCAECYGNIPQKDTTGYLRKLEVLK